MIESSGVKAPTQGALVYKLGRYPFTVEKAERYRYALQRKVKELGCGVIG